MAGHRKVLLVLLLAKKMVEWTQLVYWHGEDMQSNYAMTT